MEELIESEQLKTARVRVFVVALVDLAISLAFILTVALTNSEEFSWIAIFQAVHIWTWLGGIFAADARHESTILTVLVGFYATALILDVALLIARALLAGLHDDADVVTQAVLAAIVGGLAIIDAVAIAGASGLMSLVRLHVTGIHKKEMDVTTTPVISIESTEGGQRLTPLTSVGVESGQFGATSAQHRNVRGGDHM